MTWAIKYTWNDKPYMCSGELNPVVISIPREGDIVGKSGYAFNNVPTGYADLWMIFDIAKQEPMGATGDGRPFLHADRETAIEWNKMLKCRHSIVCPVACVADEEGRLLE